MSAIITSMGGGAREHVPGTEEWMRVESHGLLDKDLFAGVSWRLKHRGVPWFVWPMLAASVLAISSAGAAFEELHDVPPVTLAGWRLQLTSVILLIGAIWQWHKELDRDQRRVVLANWKLLSASGVCLALHFGLWVWGLQHTSLTHSLLFVCSVPVLIAMGSLLLRKPISAGELLGSLAGFAGGLLLALGPKGDQEDTEVTLAGDAASLLGAMVFIGYLLAGRELRQWMPIFVYAAPVTGLAALLLTLAAMLLEGAGLLTAGRQGAVGWLADAYDAPWIVYLSIVPGIVGHTGFNTLLRYLTPLTVSLAFQLEPLFGTLIGWMAGVVPPPGWATWLGGLVVLAATCVVTAASARREAKQEAKGQAVLELENVFASEQQGLLETDEQADHQALMADDHDAGGDHAGGKRGQGGGRRGHGSHGSPRWSGKGQGQKELLLQRHSSGGDGHADKLQGNNSSMFVIDDEDEEDGSVVHGDGVGDHTDHQHRKHRNQDHGGHGGEQAGLLAARHDTP